MKHKEIKKLADSLPILYQGIEKEMVSKTHYRVKTKGLPGVHAAVSHKRNIEKALKEGGEAAVTKYIEHIKFLANKHNLVKEDK